MQIETAKIFTSFFENRTSSVSEFEQWVYSNSDLEKDLGTDIYTDLISLNYNDKSIRVYVKKLIDPVVDYANLHKNEILKLVQELMSKSIAPLSGIRELYSWTDKGYRFLGYIDAVGNFGEQGKSIVHWLDDNMEKEHQWTKMLERHSTFINELVLLKEKIENNQIILTGEKTVVKYYGEQFKYVEKQNTKYLGI